MTQIPWTRFMDMHSGGGIKEEPYAYIYINAPEDQAKIIFYNRFGHNPDRVSCACCGNDYGITESKNLIQATANDRGCKYDVASKQYVDKPSTNNYKHVYFTIEQYRTFENVLFIEDKDIKAEERVGELPEQGYIWHDQQH